METKTSSLDNILDFAELKKLFSSFYKASGIGVALYDTKGKEQVFARDEKCICGFGKDNAHCVRQIVSSGKKAAELKSPYIYETACKLVMCIASLEIEGRTAGYITSGPVMLWDKEDFYETEFFDTCRALGIEIRSEDFDFSKIKSVSCETMNGLSEMLVMMVSYLYSENKRFFAKRREIERMNEERARDFEIMRRKSESSKLRKYPLELEKELMAYVHLGDQENARRILNDLLLEIFMFAGGDLNIIRAKLYELLAFLSRTAVEAGAETTDLSGITIKSAQLFLDKADFQTLCYTTTEILDEYLAVVYATRNGKTANVHLAPAISYMNEKYGDSELTLEAVAKEIFVSPYYLSHLFRDEMGTTFVNYLSGIRIDRAKQLLKEGVSTEDVADAVGFKDSSYFIKIFKRYIGITPAKYRKL